MLAATATGIFYHLELKTSENRQTDFGLRLSRQIVSQIETLRSLGHDRLEKDPLGWAVLALAVGSELRPVQIATLPSGRPLGTDQEREKYHFSRKNGIFNYLKIFDPEKSEGIRIRIQLGYHGFLGAETLLLNDLWVLLSFIFIFLILNHLSHARWMNPAPDAIQIELWDPQTKSSLVHLGHQIKDMVKNSHSLIRVAQDPSSGEISQTSQDLNLAITKTRESFMNVALLLQKPRDKTEINSVQNQ